VSYYPKDTINNSDIQNSYHCSKDKLSDLYMCPGSDHCSKDKLSDLYMCPGSDHCSKDKLSDLYMCPGSVQLHDFMYLMTEQYCVIF
jgi:hypothetical protein